MNYREEIDGLRAIAVSSVILYHAGITQISGGYAGVDVFFVISGFLIGGQIASAKAEGSFSYRDFYERRARRILPALFFVILCSLVVGWFTMMPHTLRYFGGAAVSAVFFVSNLWFWKRIDYFNPEAAHDPLVHTWSLAVEEQFYLFVPLLFSLLWPLGRRRLTIVLAAVAITSFAIAVSTNETHPMAAFYLIHTRAWELLAGVLAALYYAQVARKDAFGALVGNLGLMLLLAGVALTPSYTAWPGCWTLLPVLGTVMVLLFGEAPSVARRVLTLPIVTWLGLISYSAYLWHQPIFSFAKMTNHQPQSLTAALALTALVFAASHLSWKYVELPFRNRAVPMPLQLRAFGAATAVIAATAIGGHFTKGYPSRMPAEVLDILAYSGSYSQSFRKCLYGRDDVEGIDLERACVHGARVEPTVAIWGDSHAGRIAEPLGVLLGKAGLALKQLTLSSCQPIPGLLNRGQQKAVRCPQFNEKVLAYLSGKRDIETVVLFATWDNYFQRRPTRNMLDRLAPDEFYSYPVDGDPTEGDRQRKAAIVDALAKAIRSLTSAGKTVVVVGSLPRPDIDIPFYIADRAWRGENLPADVGYPVSIFGEQAEEGRSMLREAVGVGESAPGRAYFADPAPVFCDSVRCLVMRGGVPLFSDGNHPSLPGAALTLSAFARFIPGVDGDRAFAKAAAEP